MPTLSVNMPNYNHADYIGEALDAILSQSFRPLEVLVLDDGSTDNSVEIIEQFVRRDSIVKLLRNEKNMGTLYSLNRLLEHVSAGDYIVSCSADDKVLPGFFEKSMNLLKQYPQAGLCCSDPASFDAQTGLINENKLHWSDRPRYFSPDELAEVIRGEYIPGHASIMKRSAILEAGGFIPELKWHCDWFATLVVAFRHGICYMPEPLATIRVSPDTFSAAGMRDWSQQKEVLDNLLRLLKSPTYRDVLPRFVRGGVMSLFHDDILRLVMTTPGHWDMETLMLIQMPLWSWSQKNLDEQANRYNKRIEREKKVRDAFESGNAAIAQGRLDEAFRIFVDLTTEFPKLVSGHAALADVAIDRSNFPVALDALSKAIELNPNDPELFNRRGVTHYRMGSYDAAERAYQQALALDANNLDARTNLAEIARDQDQATTPPTDKHLDWPQEAIRYVQQADQFFVQGNLTAASETLREALVIVPDDPQLIVSYGNILLRLGDTEAARREFVKATLLHPDHAQAHLDLAAVLLMLGQTRDAEASVRKVLVLEPKNTDANKLFGRLCLEDGNYTEGVKAYLSVFQCDDQDVEALLALGAFCLKANDPKLAHQFFEQVLHIDPKNEMAINGLNQADGSVGDSILIAQQQNVLDKHPTQEYGSHIPWEIPIQLCINDLLNEGQCAFDVGANVGGLSITMSRIVGENGQVHAFEANPLIYPVLERDLHFNGCENVKIIPKAVWSKSDELLTLYLDERTWAQESSLVHHISSSKIEVLTTSLDSYCTANQVVPDLVKIDVEGAEFQVLSGAKKLIQESSPIFIVEYWPLGEDDPLDYLETFGYVFYDTNLYRQVDRSFYQDASPQYAPRNFVALPPSMKNVYASASISPLGEADIEDEGYRSEEFEIYLPGRYAFYVDIEGPDTAQISLSVRSRYETLYNIGGSVQVCKELGHIGLILDLDSPRHLYCELISENGSQSNIKLRHVKISRIQGIRPIRLTQQQAQGM